MHWLHFRQLNEVKNHTLDQQVRMYNEYLNELMHIQHTAWMNRGGQSGVVGPVVSGYLLQEDLSYILQEDGSRIYITL